MKPLKIILLLFAFLSAAGAATISALNWEKDNAAVESDIRLEWSGAGMIPRTEHTAIWRYNPHQQAGYYSVAWHSSTGSWDNGTYSYGTHPFPANDCTAGTDGVSLTANSGSSVHCWEEAAMGLSRDYLITPTGSTGTGTTVVKDQWYTQVRRVHLATTGTCNGKYQHDYYYDYSRDIARLSPIACLRLTWDRPRHRGFTLVGPSGKRAARALGRTTRPWRANFAASNSTTPPSPMRMSPRRRRRAPTQPAAPKESRICGTPTPTRSRPM